MSDLLRRSLAGTGGVLLVDGERGMGKSMLLGEARHEGAEQGFALATGAADRLGGRMPLFAVRMAVGAISDDDGPPDPALLPSQISGFRERLARRAETVPVLVTLDDLHWASRETLLALRVLPRELTRYPIAWILSRSVIGRDKDAECLFRALRGEGAFHVALQPLQAGVVAATLADAFGAPPDEGLLQLAEGGGGNPSLLADLVAGLREEDAIRVADGRATLASARLPRRIQRAERRWLDDVSEPTRRLLETAAVLGGQFRIGDVAEVLGAAPTALLPGIEEALDAGIIADDDDTFSFRYGLIARATAESVPRPVRRVLHRQFGEILLGHEGSAGAAASHLLKGAAHGDPASLASLDTGAGQVLRWSPRAAADLALRALELTGPGNPAGMSRAAVAAEALSAAGRPDRAARIAREALAHPLPADLEARLRSALAAALNMSGQRRDAIVQAERVLGMPEPGDPRDDALGAWLQAVTAHSHHAHAARVVDRVLASPAEHAEHAVVAARMARAMLTWDEGHGDAALELLREAARRECGISPDARHAQPLLVLAARLIDLRRLDEAASVIQAAGDKAQHPSLAEVVLSVLRTRLYLASGRLGDADAEAAAALDAAESAGAAAYASVTRSLLALIALRQGRLHDAAGYVADRAVLPPHAAACYAPAETTLASSLVTEGEQGPSAALGQIRELCADLPSLRRVVLGDPALAAWLVRTALAAGDRPLATSIVATIGALSGAGSPCLHAVGPHVRGLLGQDAESLASAAARHADPWARASCTEDLAVLFASRTARDQAIACLNQALDGYGTTGATADMARVRARLRDLGVRRRHWETPPGRPVDGWESLTDTERAVSELIARGLTNRQAANRMYISAHTVAHHLRQAFRKLSIGSRVELACIVMERAKRPDAMPSHSAARTAPSGSGAPKSSRPGAEPGPASSRSVLR